MPENRKDVLLRAAYDILKKCRDTPYVQDALTTVAFWDEAECDGHCLMTDIAIELDIEDDG